MLNALALKLIAGVGALLLVVILVQDRNHWKAKSVTLTAQIAADRKSYKDAQATAKANNIARVAEIEAKNEAVTNRVRTEYGRDLERLRAQSKANRGSAGGTQAPGVPQAPGGADGADPLRFPPGQLLRAQEIELQLKHLIEWVNRQAGVDR